MGLRASYIKKAGNSNLKIGFDVESAITDQDLLNKHEKRQFVLISFRKQQEKKIFFLLLLRYSLSQNKKLRKLILLSREISKSKYNFI